MTIPKPRVTHLLSPHLPPCPQWLKEILSDTLLGTSPQLEYVRASVHISKQDFSI